MVKKTGLTLDQHDELGKEFQDIHDRLLQIGAMITNNYQKTGQNSKAVSLINQINDGVRRLKAEMDRLVRNEHGHVDGINTDAIYYRNLERHDQS